MIEQIKKSNPQLRTQRKTGRVFIQDGKIKKIKTFINLIIAENYSEYKVQAKKEEVNVQKHSIMAVQCRACIPPVKEDQTLLFEPEVDSQRP